MWRVSTAEFLHISVSKVRETKWGLGEKIKGGRGPWAKRCCSADKACRGGRFTLKSGRRGAIIALGGHICGCQVAFMWPGAESRSDTLLLQPRSISDSFLTSALCRTSTEPLRLTPFYFLCDGSVSQRWVSVNSGSLSSRDSPEISQISVKAVQLQRDDRSAAPNWG